MKILPVLTLVVGLAPASAFAQHVHGVVELGVVVENDTVAVSLSAPLSDVIGFEHKPKNDEQAKLVQQAASMLSDPEAMFGLAASANCEFSDLTIDGPEYVMNIWRKMTITMTITIMITTKTTTTTTTITMARPSMKSIRR